MLAREPRIPLLRDIQHLLLQGGLAQGVAGEVAIGVAELDLVTWVQRERGKVTVMGKSIAAVNVIKGIPEGGRGPLKGKLKEAGRLA